MKKNKTQIVWYVAVHSKLPIPAPVTALTMHFLPDLGYRSGDIIKRYTEVNAHPMMTHIAPYVSYLNVRTETSVKVRHEDLFECRDKKHALKMAKRFKKAKAIA